MRVLDHCRKQLGSAPRSLLPDVARQVQVYYNPLLSTHPWDSLLGTFFQQTKLREHGQIVWAQVLQANDFLFNPGLNGESHPATVIHAGPELDDPKVLEEIALRMEASRQSRPTGPDDKTVEVVLHPSRRKHWVRVPESITGEHQVFASDLLIFRKLLPAQSNGATLQKLHFPLFVARQETRYIMQVPSCFWPKEFVDYWETQSL